VSRQNLSGIYRFIEYEILMKKSLFIFLLVTLIEIISVSCTLFCPCGSCDSGPAKKIDIVSWQMQTISDKHLGVDPTTTYPFDKVFKALSTDQVKIVYNQETTGSPFNIANACSPAPLQAIQTFTSIQIKSMTETAYLHTNDIIKEGDDITDRFAMTFLFDMNFKPIHEFINSMIIYDQDKYQLKLKERPFQKTNLKFDVIITLSDGKVFELKNEELTIN